MGLTSISPPVYSPRNNKKGHNMTEPTSTAGTFVGYKLALFSLPVLTSLIAFWLGLRFVPLRGEDQHGDLLSRVLACLVSGFILGVPTLVLLVQHYSGIFDASVRLAQIAQLPAIAGFFVITGCVFVIASIPGPWLMAAVFLWLKKSEGKTLTDIAQDMRGDLRKLRQPLPTENQPAAQNEKEPTP